MDLLHERSVISADDAQDPLESVQRARNHEPFPKVAPVHQHQREEDDEKVVRHPEHGKVLARSVALRRRGVHDNHRQSNQLTCFY